MEYKTFADDTNIPQGYRLLYTVIIRMKPSFDNQGLLIKSEKMHATVVTGCYPIGHTAPDHMWIRCNPFDGGEFSKFDSFEAAQKRAAELAKVHNIPHVRHETDQQCAELYGLWPKWYAYKRKAKEKEAAERMKRGEFWRSDFPNTPAGERAYQNAVREAEILQALRK